MSWMTIHELSQAEGKKTPKLKPKTQHNQKLEVTEMIGIITVSLSDII